MSKSIKYKLKDISKINEASIKTTEKLKKVIYLDTSNLKNNVINSFQHFDLSIDKLPSRARRKVKENTILYSTVRPNQNHFGILKGLDFNNILVSTGYTTIDVNYKKADPNYVYYYITEQTQIERLQSIAEQSTTSYPSITPEDIKNIDIELPDVRKQIQISKIFSDLDKKIFLNNKINDNLEQQVATIYDYWFTQFDFPNDDGKPYCSSGGQMEWNYAFKRNIPIGWEVKSVISNCLSSVIKPGVETFDTKLYLATADVKGTSISTGTITSYENRESRANMQPSINSVWFAKMKNSIKHLNLNKEMQPVISNTILSTGFCGLQCSEESFEYIASYIANPYFEIHKDMLAHGATQEAINNDDLAGINIIIPSDDVLHAYHEITRPIYAQISKNICENQELVKLRDWLLPMLMNGQATIGD